MLTVWLEVLVICCMICHVFICPYSKVEESFNMQAIHDILYYTSNISQYDHLQFPGVVPRSFLGPLFVALSSSPLVATATWFQVEKIYVQYITRIALGNAVLVAFFLFHQAVRDKCGSGTSKMFLIVTVTQFHFMFYMTRTLPNIFALILVLLALRAWIQQHHVPFLWLSGAAILIFRTELALFLGILLLMDIIGQRVSIVSVVMTTIPAAVVLLGLTVAVDSYFWQRYLWPEGEVLWYNTILNKSSNWGTLPFLWYFYSALPRALSCSIVLVPVGLCLTPRLTTLVLPAVLFVFLYSFLPHKELRFIIYVIPVCNVAVAEAVHRLWINRNKSMFRKLLAVGAVLHLLGNICTTAMFLYTSHMNYPGGEALARLHQLEKTTADVHVHIDVAAAQTGVTRFGQLNNHWIYNKTEDLIPGGPDMMSYTHLLVGDPDNLAFYKNSHSVVSEITAFDRIEINRKKPPFIFWVQAPKIWILKKK